MTIGPIPPAAQVSAEDVRQAIAALPHVDIAGQWLTTDHTEYCTMLAQGINRARAATAATTGTIAVRRITRPTEVQTALQTPRALGMQDNEYVWVDVPEYEVPQHVDVKFFMAYDYERKARSWQRYGGKLIERVTVAEAPREWRASDVPSGSVGLYRDGKLIGVFGSPSSADVATTLNRNRIDTILVLPETLP